MPLSPWRVTVASVIPLSAKRACKMLMVPSILLSKSSTPSLLASYTAENPPVKSRPSLVCLSCVAIGKISFTPKDTPNRET